MIKVIELETHLEIESPSYWLGLNVFKKWSWKDLNVFKPWQLFTTVWYVPYVEDPISEQGYKCFWRLIKAARHRIYAIILFEGSCWLSEPLCREQAIDWACGKQAHCSAKHSCNTPLKCRPQQEEQNLQWPSHWSVCGAWWRQCWSEIRPMKCISEMRLTYFNPTES